jgi:uncharacterized membrane protein
MHNMPLRFFLYIAAIEAGLAWLVAIPEFGEVSSIVPMLNSLAAAFRTLFSALP